jgi:beta-glucanase (GH16 family)
MIYYIQVNFYLFDAVFVAHQEPGGMLTTWNKFCFTGGIIETAVSLPGSPDVSGFWPAVWSMGNLGRVGYGATTDGLVIAPSLK